VPALLDGTATGVADPVGSALGDAELEVAVLGAGSEPKVGPTLGAPVAITKGDVVGPRASVPFT